MRLEYAFDTICPWCYIGKRRLEQALSKRPDVCAQITWRPFLLDPDISPQGMDRHRYLEQKFGGSGRIQRVQQAVIAAGESVGIIFAFEKIAMTPNSLNSHRLIRYAQDFGCQAEMVESIFSAYFQLGIDIGSITELVILAQELGLDGPLVRQYLESDDARLAILHDNARIHRLGINGVPCLIVDGRYALAGAQEPDILLRMIDIARQEQMEKK